MGRWATYRRRGGGPPPSAALLFIEVAEVQLDDTIDVAYNGNVNQADFSPADFLTHISDLVPVSISQGDVNQIVLHFVDDIQGEASITYSGDAPGILTPQTLDLS